MGNSKVDEANIEGRKTNLVVTDMELELNIHPIGKVVHLSTVTHAWRGTLLSVDSTYYVLDASKPVALVDETGPMAEYMTSMTKVYQGDAFEPGKKTAPTVRILRAAVAWMISAP